MPEPDPLLASALMILLELDDDSAQAELVDLARTEFEARLAKGVEVNGYYEGSTLLAHAVEWKRAALAKTLIQHGSDIHAQAHARGRFGSHSKSVAFGADDPLLARILFQAGARAEDFSTDMLPAALGLLPSGDAADEPLNKALASIVTGQRNPEPIANAFYDRQIRTFQSASAGLVEHTDASRDDRFDLAPSFSFDRLGRSVTSLKDGRVVLIAGVHEDRHDPNHHVYNDVCVVQPDGKFDYFAYDPDAFPPTIDHSATEVAGDLWLIGNDFWYSHQKMPAQAQVLRLDLRTFRMSPVVTKGRDPGSIFGHEAKLEGSEILISGAKAHPRRPDLDGQTYALETNTGTWRLL